MADGYSILLTGLLVLAKISPGMNLPAADPVAPPDVQLQYFRSICRGFIGQQIGQDAELQRQYQTFLEFTLQTIEGQRGAEQLSLLQGLTVRETLAFYRLICGGQDNAELASRLNWSKAFSDMQAIETELSSAQFDYHARLFGRTWPQSVEIRDARNNKISDLVSAENRLWISGDDLPELLKQAFIASEDKNFLTHKGFEPAGLLRAILSAAENGRIVGGSTITQQLVKNALLGPKQTLDRKFKELLLAHRIEADPLLDKRIILEFYLNVIFFGREAYGIRKAAEVYFAKRPSELTVSEMAFLAGVIVGPSNLEPFRVYTFKDSQGNSREVPGYRRAIARRNYVIDRMQSAGLISADTAREAKVEVMVFARRRGNRYFTKYVQDEIDSRAQIPREQLARGGIVYRTGLDAPLQSTAEAELQDGLFFYEYGTAGRPFGAPVASVATRAAEIKKGFDAIRESIIENAKAESEIEDLSAGAAFGGNPAPKAPAAKPAPDFTYDQNLPWRNALAEVPNRFPDIWWDLAMVIEKGYEKARVGFIDGTVLPLEIPRNVRLDQNLEYGDVVWVRRFSKRASLRQIPEVEGAVLAINTQTGDILTYVGGFTFSRSQYDRVRTTRRQVGSLLKPFVFLEGLSRGLEPNDRLCDLAGQARFAPIDRGGQTWTPRNYGDKYDGSITMQRALEQSKNVPTALILAALPATPDGYTGLDSIMDLTQEYGLYDWTRPEDRQRERHYPFILGSADTSLLNVVTAYARIGNGGLRVRPLPGLRIEYLDRSPVVGASIDRSDLGEVQMVPAVARHQIRQMLQGVVRQGTAASLSRFAPALAGKTGTTDESRDVWFVGTSPQITMGVWIGYDNKKFLSSGATGGGIAVPIFDRIFDTFVDLQGPPVPFATTVPGIEMRWVDNASGALTFENKSASLMALKAPGRAPKIGGCR